MEIYSCKSTTFSGLMKLFKGHLKSIASSALLSYEEFLTFAIQFEDILNSRIAAPAEYGQLKCLYVEK